MGAKLKATISESAINNVDNTSLVTVRLTISWTSGSYNLNNKSGYIIIDGTKYTFSNSFNDNRTSSGSKVLATKSKTVVHSADGTKTVSCSGYYQTGTSAGNITWSGKKALTNIPRNAVLGSIPNFIFDNGNAFDVPITSYVNTYYNVLQIKYNDTIIATRANYTGNTVTLRDDEINNAYTLMYASNSANWDFSLSTYTDSSKTTVIGVESTAIGQASISSIGSAPTFSNTGISAKDTNTKTLAITNDENAFIKGFSNLELTLNNKATANKQATLGDSAYSFASTGLPTQYANQSDALPIIKTFQGVTNNQYVITATDSRGNSTSITNTINMIDYSVPVITSFTAKRVQPNLTGETAEINCTGTFFTSEQITNSLTAKYRFKENSDSATYGEYYDISVAISNNNFNIVGNLPGIFNIEKSYVIEIKISDNLSDVLKEVILLSANPTIDIDTNSNTVAIGKIIDGTYNTSLELAYPLSIENGGTGANTSNGALANILEGNIIAIENGGTGVSDIDSLRNLLGIGTKTTISSYLSADQSITAKANTSYRVKLDTVSAYKGDKITFDTTNNQFVIGAGVSTVKISGAMAMRGIANSCRLIIKKHDGTNYTDIAQIYLRNTNAAYTHTLALPALTIGVTENEALYLVFLSAGSGSVVVNGGIDPIETYMTVEEV